MFGSCFAPVLKRGIKEPNSDRNTHVHPVFIPLYLRSRPLRFFQKMGTSPLDFGRRGKGKIRGFLSAFRFLSFLPRLLNEAANPSNPRKIKIGLDKIGLDGSHRGYSPHFEESTRSTLTSALRLPPALRGRCTLEINFRFETIPHTACVHTPDANFHFESTQNAPRDLSAQH